MQSPEREQADLEKQQSAWLAREEGIRNHLKMTASAIRWGHWMLRVLLLLVALIALVGGVLKRKFDYLLMALLFLIPSAVKVFRQPFNSSYKRAYAEVDAALDAVRRGVSGSFPPEYTPETQKLREPLLGEISRQLAILAAFLLFCAAAFIGLAVFLMVLILTDEGPSAFFWGVSPVFFLLLLIGLPLGAMGITSARNAWNARK